MGMSQSSELPRSTFRLVYACLSKIRTFSDGVNCPYTGQPIWDHNDEAVYRMMQDEDRRMDAKRG